MLHFDHHCVWLGTCIGKRNYKLFIYFISTLAAICLYVGAMAILSIARKVSEDRGDTGEGVGDRWYSIVFFVYAFVVSFVKCVNNV